MVLERRLSTQLAHLKAFRQQILSQLFVLRRFKNLISNGKFRYKFSRQFLLIITSCSENQKPNNKKLKLGPNPLFNATLYKPALEILEINLLEKHKTRQLLCPAFACLSTKKNDMYFFNSKYFDFH